MILCYKLLTSAVV